MIDYPHYDELSPADRAECYPTYISIEILAALGYHIAPLATERSQAHKPLKRIHVRKEGSERKSYASRYVGITVRRGRWMAQMGPRGQTVCKVFSSAPEDELRAAEYRAQVLGLPEPELRK